jgi:hypothetical protein
MEANVAKGLTRTKDGWGNEDSVRVRYPDGNELDLPAPEYKAKGYQPPFDDLLWTHDDA